MSLTVTARGGTADKAGDDDGGGGFCGWDGSWDLVG